MSYYGNMNISGERGMEIEYEGMVNNISDDQTESEYSDSKRHRTPPNTGTETHFIITTTSSLGLNKLWFAQKTKLKT